MGELQLWPLQLVLGHNDIYCLQLFLQGQSRCDPDPHPWSPCFSQTKVVHLGKRVPRGAHVVYLDTKCVPPAHYVPVTLSPDDHPAKVVVSPSCWSLDTRSLTCPGGSHSFWFNGPLAVSPGRKLPPLGKSLTLKSSQ